MERTRRRPCGLINAYPGAPLNANVRLQQTIVANSQIVAELEKFIGTPKFSADCWKTRLANPSSDQMCQRMESLVNDVARKVQHLVQAEATPSTIKGAIASALRSTRTHEFDTEEREFICDQIERVARIANVKVGNVLNRWLYGAFLGTVINVFRGPAKN